MRRYMSYSELRTRPEVVTRDSFSTASPSMNQLGCTRLGATILPNTPSMSRGSPRMVSRCTTCVSSCEMSTFSQSSKSFRLNSGSGGTP